MSDHVILLSIPNLRRQDLAAMPNLRALTAGGESTSLVPSFPCVSACVQANMTTGKLPNEHGVVSGDASQPASNAGDPFYSTRILQPQIWDTMHGFNPALTSAAWFPHQYRGVRADYVCGANAAYGFRTGDRSWQAMPVELHETLRGRLGEYPASEQSTSVSALAWIADSAVIAAERYRPNFFYLCLPHLEAAAKRDGPDSPDALGAIGELDAVLGRLVAGMRKSYAGSDPLWIVVSEYTVVPVHNVMYPNRILREAGLLSVIRDGAGQETVDRQASAAWALVEAQFSHVYVNGSESRVFERVVKLFQSQEGFADVWSGEDLVRAEIAGPRTGDIVLISKADSCQLADCGVTATTSMPLPRGSHGAPAIADEQRGVILTSEPGVLEGPPMADYDVCELILRQFGI